MTQTIERYTEEENIVDGRVVFNRPPRIQRSLPRGKVEIPNPPEPQFKGGGMGWAIVVVPIIIAVATAVALIVATVFGRAGGSSILFLLSTGVMSIGVIITGLINIFEKIHNDREHKREYQELLVEREEQLREYSRQQQTIQHYLYPSLPQVMKWVRERELRLWERRGHDQDFLSIRLGIGSRPSSIELNEVKSDKKLPFLERAIKISTVYKEVPNVPEIVELDQVAFLGIAGPPSQTAPFLRSILSHLTAHHSPNDVKVMATYAPERSADWFWLGWLPHGRIATNKGGEIPLVASHSDQLETLTNFILEEIKRRDNKRHATSTVGSGVSIGGGREKKKAGYQFPNLVWVIDDFALVQDEPAVKKVFEMGAELGVFMICTSSDLSGVPTQCRALIEILPNAQARFSVSGEGGRISTLQPDRAGLEFCEEFALQMAPIQLKADSGKGEFPTSLRLLDMLGIDASKGEPFDPLNLWNKSAVGQLKVPIGRVFGGQECFLDLSDKGHGPHGLLAGTTGSGKSELLLTIVCALAMSNHPDNLNFVLGDFKGGATFNPLANLPHVVGMISDLDLTMVERAMTAIFSELKRREHLLKEEGVTHIRDYQKKKPTPKEPMPYLLVIIDEFAEMKEQAPDFMEKIINIARTGRTLGVHLILATQRPAGVVTGQLNSNTKFRICLRVETTDDSSDMLGRKDAALIASNMPGRAFFKVGSDIYEQFQVGRVAIPFNPAADDSDDKPAIVFMDNYWRGSYLLPEQVKRGPKVEKEGVEAQDCDIIAKQCAEAAKRTVIRNTHKPWLDPMLSRYFLPDFLKKGEAFDPDRLSWPQEPPFGYGVAPMAMIDGVVEQVQKPLYMDLAKDGCYSISGLGVSGKTMFIRNMITTLAMTHHPNDLKMCLIDMGNTLKCFTDLPHVNSYVPMSKQPMLKDVVNDLFEELNYRKNTFAEAGVLDIASYNRQAVEQGIPKIPGIFIAFDNYASIRANPPYDTEQLKSIVREGRAYGMHLAVTMDKAIDFEYGRMIGQFLQFALRQSRDDIIFPVPKNMVGSWNGIPGRGFIQGPPTKPPLEIQVFLPLKVEPDDQVKALEILSQKMKEAVRGQVLTNEKLGGNSVATFEAEPAPTSLSNNSRNNNSSSGSSNSKAKHSSAVTGTLDYELVGTVVPVMSEDDAAEIIRKFYEEQAALEAAGAVPEAQVGEDGEVINTVTTISAAAPDSASASPPPLPPLVPVEPVAAPAAVSAEPLPAANSERVAASNHGAADGGSHNNLSNLPLPESPAADGGSDEAAQPRPADKPKRLRI